MFISIAITVLLAGLRDLSVGTDTSHYYRNLWAQALRSQSFWAFMRTYYRYYPSKEMLYAVLLGACARLTGDFHVFLTLVHMIIIGCVYAGAFRLERYSNPCLTLTLFYLFYYNHSLNIIRQYMAMAILFAATADILNRNYKRYLITVLVAMMFHNSAFFGILPLILYEMMYPQKRLRSIPLQRRLLLYALIIVGVFLLRPVVRVLIQIGIASQKYEGYLQSEGENTYAAARLLSLIEILGIAAFLRSYRRYDTASDFFLICTIAFGVLYQVAPSINYGRRIPIYFGLINLVSIGLLAKCPHKKSNSIIIGSLAVLAALLYWIVMYGHYNTSQTIPYVLGV